MRKKLTCYNSAFICFATNLRDCSFNVLKETFLDNVNRSIIFFYLCSCKLYEPKILLISEKIFLDTARTHFFLEDPHQ